MATYVFAANLEWFYLRFLWNTLLARTQLCSTALPNNGLVFAVGGIHEELGGQELSPSSLSIPSQSAYEFDVHSLSVTAEVLDYRTSRWIPLPEPIFRGPLIGACLAQLDSYSSKQSFASLRYHFTIFSLYSSPPPTPPAASCSSSTTSSSFAALRFMHNCSRS